MILASLSFSVFHSIERNTEKLKLVVIRRLGQTYEVPPREVQVTQFLNTVCVKQDLDTPDQCIGFSRSPLPGASILHTASVKRSFNE